MEETLQFDASMMDGYPYSQEERDRESYRKIVAYYEDAGPDYEAWSKNYNMHFGYGSLSQLFHRERMLDRMSREVLDGLQLSPEAPARVLDLGCGVAATMREGGRLFPLAEFTGVTIVPWQVRKANELNHEAGLEQNLTVMLADYTHMPFPDNSFDAVYAIESACHASGHAKDQFIREMYRVLKPGGRFAVADGFLKREENDLSPAMAACYRGICDNWALPAMAEIHKFEDYLTHAGFEHIEKRDISWRVSVSVAHVPFVITKFILQRIARGKKIKRQSINNLKGSFLTMILGMDRGAFGYYIVSGIKN